KVVATAGAVYRYWRQGQVSRRLALVLIAGTTPGVVAGSVIRVELLPGPQAFALVVAVVLIPLGVWLGLSPPPAGRQPGPAARSEPDFDLGIRKAAWLVALAAAGGCAGGIYGIGGGAVPAPRLIGTPGPPGGGGPGAPAP